MAEGGILMEVPSDRIVAPVCRCRVRRVIDGRVYVLEGARGQLLRVDPVSGAQQVLEPCPASRTVLPSIVGCCSSASRSRVKLRNAQTGSPWGAKRTTIDQR